MSVVRVGLVVALLLVAVPPASAQYNPNVTDPIVFGQWMFGGPCIDPPELFKWAHGCNEVWQDPGEHLSVFRHCSPNHTFYIAHFNQTHCRGPVVRSYYYVPRKCYEKQGPEMLYKCPYLGPDSDALADKYGRQ